MTRSTRLSDLQLILLSHAANTLDGQAFPLPAAASHNERTITDLKALLRRGLLAEVETTNAGASWREDGDLRFGLMITEQGTSALGLADDAEPAGPTSTTRSGETEAATAPERDPRRGSKIANVLGLLRRPGGATLAELVEATGWQAHTTRAALTGLKKKGHVIDKGKRGEPTCYMIAGER